MSFEDTVKEIRSDFKCISNISREELLASCASFRIKDLNDKYSRQFDKLLKSLEEDCLCERDFNNLSSSIKTMSNTLCVLYDTLLNHIEFYNKNLFK